MKGLALLFAIGGIMLSSAEAGSPAKTETALLAGGCFWGMEDILRKHPGVLETQVGYTGGFTENPKYPEVKTGKTGHAEAIEIRFDPSKTTFRAILELFFKMHDPTTLNRQGKTSGLSTARPSSTCQKNKRRRQKRPRRQSIRRASGRSRSSPKSRRLRSSIRPRTITRTIW